MSGAEEVRCPSCGALASADAEWCGQCFSSLRAQDGAPEVAVAGLAGGPRAGGTANPPGAGPALGGEPTAPNWPCAVCDSRNAIEADVCAFCGAPFGKTLERSEARPRVEPMTAFTRSLIFPGLGHKALGRGLEGFVRTVLFVWTVGTAAMLWSSGSAEGGLGGAAPMIMLFGVSALFVYLVTAVDAYRGASGTAPVLPSRVWLWLAAALVMVSALLAALAIAGAARAR